MQVPNAFTVDVEDYFHVSAFEHRVCKKTWSQFESRVVPNTERILKLLDVAGIRATFFVLGWVADRHPELVQAIHRDGHELASHGYWHRLVYDQTPDEFAEDLRMSRDAIGNAAGVHTVGYRAPSFSIIQRSLWALDILIEQGFAYDSSIFPIRGHHRYGIADAKCEIHRVKRDAGEIIEFPPSAWHVGPTSVPIGGGYFRLLPFSISLKAIRSVRQAGRPAMFYIHPWEIDPDQPKIAGTKSMSRAKHFAGLNRTYQRLEVLLERFPFTAATDVIASIIDPQVQSESAPFEQPVCSS